MLEEEEEEEVDEVDEADEDWEEEAHEAVYPSGEEYVEEWPVGQGRSIL